jgi:hypothetical protein
MIAREEDIIEKLPEFLCGRGKIDMKHRIARFCRGHVVRLWADTANASSYARKFLYGTPNTKLFEPAQLGDLKVGICHLAIVIQKDVDFAVAF